MPPLVTVLTQLARSPRRGAAAILVAGRLRTAAGLVAIATVFAAANAMRAAADVPIAAVLYGEDRTGTVTALLEALGRERSAVVLYLVERSWDAVLILTAAAPVLSWVLGATAIHAAARLQGRHRPYRPMLVLLGYAVALARLPADLAGALLGSGPGPGPGIAQLLGAASIVLLGVIAWRGIQAHYGLARGPALNVLIVAITLFYLVPLIAIVLAVVGLVIAAAVLGLVPGR